MTAILKWVSAMLAIYELNLDKQKYLIQKIT